MPWSAACLSTAISVAMKPPVRTAFGHGGDSRRPAHAGWTRANESSLKRTRTSSHAAHRATTVSFWPESGWPCIGTSRSTSSASRRRSASSGCHHGSGKSPAINRGYRRLELSVGIGTLPRPPLWLDRSSGWVTAESCNRVAAGGVT